MKREEALAVAKPILFNTEMVMAIQNATKTVTRRVIKPRFRENECEFFTATIAGQLFLCYSDEDDEETRRIKAPYQVGDILYVRETWTTGCIVGNSKSYYVSQGERSYVIFKEDCQRNHISIYDVVWKPSIHMPKWAARIFLQVTDVRVERLQDITDEDMVRDFALCPEAVNAVGKDVLVKTVWNSTVKKSDLDKYGWAANPGVVVIEFEKVEMTENG